MSLLPAEPAFDGDEAPMARVRFRAFLLERVGTADALAWYLAEALPGFAAHEDVREAVGELIDHAGRFLGFTATHAADLQCSRWQSVQGHELLVRALAPADAARQVSALARLREIALARGEARTVSGLGVVCGDADSLQVDDAVMVRRAANAVRLVSAARLVSLARACGDGTLRHEDAVTLLKPAALLADAHIDVAARGGD